MDMFFYSYSRVAYCDVTGRESRLPLRVTSQGIGPRLIFSFDTLDIQNVFINSAHAYEVYVEQLSVAQLVEHLVEHLPCKQDVMGSNPT